MYRCAGCEKLFEKPAIVLYPDPSPQGVSLPFVEALFEECPHCHSGFYEVEQCAVNGCEEYVKEETDVICEKCKDEIVEKFEDFVWELTAKYKSISVIAELLDINFIDLPPKNWDPYKHRIKGGAKNETI